MPLATPNPFQCCLLPITFPSLFLPFFQPWRNFPQGVSCPFCRSHFPSSQHLFAAIFLLHCLLSSWVSYLCFSDCEAMRKGEGRSRNFSHPSATFLRKQPRVSPPKKKRREIYKTHSTSFFPSQGQDNLKKLTWVTASSQSFCLGESTKYLVQINFSEFPVTFMLQMEGAAS